MNSKGLGMTEVLDKTGATKVWSGVDKLSEDIKFKLLTPIGSLLGNPEFGSTLRSAIYKQGTNATVDLVITSVHDVLSSYAGVTVIDVSGDYSQDRRSIEVVYTIEYNATKIDNTITIKMEG
jgi:phage baseplate assembly protein W